MAFICKVSKAHNYNRYPLPKMSEHTSSRLWIELRLFQERYLISIDISPHRIWINI
jgi:hypothetical protein